MSEDVFKDLSKAIAGLDKFAQYYDDKKAWQSGESKRADIFRLFQAAASVDPRKAKTIYKAEMGQEPPATSEEVQAKRKENEEKVFVAILGQLRSKFDWINLKNPQNSQPAQFICQAYNTLSKESQEFVDGEIIRLSKGHYKNHRDFCMNLYAKFLRKNL